MSNSPTDYANQLDGILSQPLTPEIIDDYGQHALDQVIELAGRVVADFKVQAMTASQLIGAAAEKAAFAYFGLRDIESVLDHLAAIVASINEISTKSHSVIEADHVILPPDKAKYTITPGSGSYEKPAVIPRLMTILFILRHSFDVNIQDTNQIVLRKGVLKEEMMRKVSYVLVDVAKLNRIILVCDEEGNATFVFDRILLEYYGVTIQDVERYTKSELRQVLEETPTIGRYIVYSSRFVGNITVAIEQSFEAKEKRDEHNGSGEIRNNFLYPRAPEDFLRIGDLAAMWRIDPATLKRVITESNEALGPVVTYMCTWLSRSKPTPHYSPEQQATLYQELQRRGLFAETAPEGFHTTIELEALWVISRPTIKLLIDELGSRLGEVATYRTRRGRNTALHYSPAQQMIILQEAERRNMIVEKAPEDVLSATGLAQQLGTDPPVVLRAVSKLKSQLGEIKRYRFAGQRTDGYTPVQQELLRQYIDRAEEAPENYLTIDGMAKAFGTTYQPVKNATDKLAGSLGEVEAYKFHTGIMNGYSPTQQQLIYNFLMAKGLFAEPAPQGFLSQKRLADQLGVAEGTVTKALEELGDKLGEVKVYRFHAQTVPGYSPDQQTVLRVHLEAKGTFAEAASAGVLSSNGMAKAWKIRVEVVSKAIEELGEKLGEIKLYMFRRPAPGYTLEQQEVIRQYIADHLTNGK